MSVSTPPRTSLGLENWEKLRTLKEQQNVSQAEDLNKVKQKPSTISKDENTHNLKKPWEEKRKEYEDVIEWLCKTFPATFNFKKPLPLKLHITKDLYSHLPEDGSISKVKLRAAIQYYTHSTSYLKSLINSTYRIDLNGQENEPVLDAHKEFSQSILDNRTERKKALKPNPIQKKRFDKNRMPFSSPSS